MAALNGLAQEEAFEWDWEVVLSGSEVAKDKPDDWVLEAYFPRKPGKARPKAGNGGGFDLDMGDAGDDLDGDFTRRGAA